MSDPEIFRQVKSHFGTMDDLCQERRRLYTRWASGGISPEEFGTALRRNLSSTRRTADALEASLGMKAGDS